MIEESHPLYTGDPGVSPNERLIIVDDANEPTTKFPIRFKLQKPKHPETGETWDQTNDAADHMRYAHSLKLPELIRSSFPRMGRAIIVGGAPSIADHLETIRALKSNKDNFLFAVNWSHTWLIERGIIPDACVFFEIDAEPEDTLKALHDGVTYYVCSHCHPKTFDECIKYKCVLWHSPPNSPPEEKVGSELFPGSNLVGGGIGTFTRTLTIALHLGFRNIELFGCDSSFPDKGKTHVDGYDTKADNQVDGLYVYAKHAQTGTVRRFRTMGYLALQVEEFKEYCKVNHVHYALRVHGDSLLRFVHQNTYPNQYNPT